MRLISTALLVVTVLASGMAPAAAAPEGQMTWGIHISLAPTWFDPAETTGIVTPFMVMYALHDAMVKPLPGDALASSLAESWTVSPDGLAYEFLLRKGTRFHNGDPVTAEAVKFSLERYRGRQQDVQRTRGGHRDPEPGARPHPPQGAVARLPHVLFERDRRRMDRAQEVRRKNGDEGFKKHPIDAGPYRFVSFTPGVELVMEAVDQYWRKTPSVRRLVFKAIPDPSTRFAALKRGEIDVSYWMTASLREELQRTPGLTLKPAAANNTYWVYFVDQWDPKSPWHDRRVRLAANHAIDRQGLNQAETLGFSRMTNSFVPAHFEFFWQPPAIPYDVAKARQAIPTSTDSSASRAAELDRKRREATLHRIQQLVHEKAMFAPIFQLAAMGGFGPRVQESGLGLINGFPFAGPYEDVKLKTK